MTSSENDAGDDHITINILSLLPEGEPQGSFVIRVSPTATGRDLLRLVCKEARVGLHLAYILHTNDGVVIPMEKQLASISSIQEGRNLHWNTSGNLRGTAGGCWNVHWFMALLSLLIGCTGLIAIMFIYFHTSDNTQYGIVFDAGSSHTSMFIYKWEGGKVNLTAVATQDGTRCTADGGGISSYANEPERAGLSLEKCLNTAKEQIPVDIYSSTPIYLGATAGMRLLHKKNSSASEEVLESVRRAIGSYPFQFGDISSQVRILTGAEEGAFSWITSNYITGSFHVHPPTDHIIPDLVVSSVGAMDLGGASTQISFIPKNASGVPEDLLFILDLYGTNYSLYTHSFLCYGVNEAANRLLAVLVAKAEKNRTSLNNPCAPLGYAVNITIDSIFSSACVTGQDANIHFGQAITAPPGMDQDAVYEFHGDSNITACRDLVAESLFNFSCPKPPCSFNGIYQPPLTGDFYAFSSYFYIMQFLNLTAKDTIQYTDFSSATQSLCALNWTQVKEMKTDVPENLPWYCFQSVYIDIMLVDGYNFTSNATWRSIHFVDTISGIDAGWTLGFIINESNTFPATAATKDLTVVTFALLAVLFCAFIILTLFFVRWARRQQRASSTSLFVHTNRYGAI